MSETPTCKHSPYAPHGYNRQASHNAGRYVCDCEGWQPETVTIPLEVWNAAYGLAMGALHNEQGEPYVPKFNQSQWLDCQQIVFDCTPTAMSDDLLYKLKNALEECARTLGDLPSTSMKGTRTNNTFRAAKAVLDDIAKLDDLANSHTTPEKKNPQEGG